MNEKQTNKWYTAKDIADYFSVSINTVRSWLYRKQMPPPTLQAHRFTRWSAESIEPFLANPLTWRANAEQDKQGA